MKHGPSVLLMAGLVLTVTAGCRSFGPQTVTHDRSDYNRSIADSWKEQALLNIVKMRYLDLPIWLDVGQVVSGYSMETSGNIGGQLSSAKAIQRDSFTLGAQGKFTDRPTITYVPLTGQGFLEGFLAPVQPSKIFYLLQAGYAADFILELSVESLNGLNNRPTSFASTRQADPEFFRLLALLREIQDAGAVGMRVEGATNGQPAAVLFFRSERLSSDLQAKSDQARQMLGAEPGTVKFRLVSSPVRGGPGEITVGSRSLMQMMMALAVGVEVPPSHKERRLTPPMADIPAEANPLMRIHSGTAKPSDVFVAMPYEGAWFWIANDDWRTKRTFTSILYLFSLADTGGAEKLPTITIPAQ
jgi:hypothetical protein